MNCISAHRVGDLQQSIRLCWRCKYVEIRCLVDGDP